MRYLSVCSGIEAATAAWHPLGWKAAAFSEIEAFPRAVLAHHYPAVPLHGDFTTIEAGQYGPIDILVGGTPCQDFSVAGLRAGIAGDRGNLTLEFLRLAARTKPRWIVWENVPGVLSSDGGRAITSFMDGLEALGYICDIEILDAQFFGLAQRRRRVFVCAQHREDLLKQKTDTSALTIAQVLQEILHAILIEASTRSGSAPASSASPSLSRDGAKRRMELFGLHGEVDCWPMLLVNLAAAFQRYPSAQSALAAILGESEKAPTRAAQSTASQTETLFTRTERLFSAALADAYEVMKSFITSTGTNSTTPTQIYTCSRAALLIAALTRHLNQSSPTFWSAASSSLTAVEEFIAYARHTSSDLFGDLERVQSWRDFIEQAEGLCESLGDIGIECFGEVLPVSESLLWNPAPRRETGEGVAPSVIKGAAIGRQPHNGPQYGDTISDGSCYTLNCTERHAVVAPTISARTKGGGGLGTDYDCDGGLIPEVCPTLRAGGNSTGGDRPPGTDVDTVESLIPIVMASGQSNAPIFDNDQCPALTCLHEAPIVAMSVDLQNVALGGDVAGTLDTTRPGRGGGQAVLAHSLRGEGFDASEDGTGRGTPLVACEVADTLSVGANQTTGFIGEAVAFKIRCGDQPPAAGGKGYLGSDNLAFTVGPDQQMLFAPVKAGAHPPAIAFYPTDGREFSTHDNISPPVKIGSGGSSGNPPAIAFSIMPMNSGKDYKARETDVAQPLMAGGPVGGNQGGDIVAQPVAFDMRGREGGAQFEGPHNTANIRAASGGSSRSYVADMAVRRLTPRECERLQGFPDDYTLVPYRGKPASDGPRYKALGNSMAVPVMRWIGERIATVEDIASHRSAA